MGLKLGDISPAAALMGSEGALNSLMAKGGMGLVPHLMTKDGYKDRKEEEKQKQAGGPPQMKKGGTVPKMAKGGSCSKKMAKGGSVCRGGGAATKGVKFKGVM